MQIGFVTLLGKVQKNACRPLSQCCNSSYVHAPPETVIAAKALSQP